jgi:uncharacterized damage-inducible protein DinB
MDVELLFLKFSVDKLGQFTERIEVCLGNLNEDQIWARGHDNENAVGNLALHLAGNVRQWIISSLGDYPHSRDRDSEFTSRGGVNASELTRNLRGTVEQASQIISGLNTAQLTRMYEVQQYTVSGVEIVYHVVEHFAQHTGQIIFATKNLTKEDLGFYRHLSNPAHREHVP